MRNIGDQIKSQTSLLRYSDAAVAQLSGSAGQGVFQNVTDATEATKIQTIIRERFTNGYALVRHRTAPGQVTVAFTRSPLLPVVVPRPPGLPAFSINGQDYQILDQNVGILDISYSTAFQFGKSLASSDMGFVAALMRIRGNVHTAGAAAADTAVAEASVTTSTKVAVLTALPAATERIVQMSKVSSDSTSASLKDRWSQAQRPVSKSFRDVNNSKWKAAYVKAAKERMAILASAAPVKSSSTAAPRPSNARMLTESSAAETSIKTTTTSSTAAAETTGTPVGAPPATMTPYNDLTSPVSTDWAFLFNWIMDKLFLDNIPVHYLITDPAHLPTESIRFFHIDPTWLDCLIDGALSVANHLSSDDDVVRQFIKTEINNYLSTPVGSGATAHLPQVPLYGFFLRSAVVKVFPDLQVSIPYPSGQGAGLTPILVQKRMASDILMVLLDRLPDGGQISTIRFTQPAHQQCFSAGDSLDNQTIEFLFRKVYRTTATQAAANDALHEFGSPHSWSITTTSSNAYDWLSRCLNFAIIEKELFTSTDGLVAEMPADWGPPVQPLLTSSMTGIQLNDTIKYLEVLPAQSVVASPAGISLPRQIYVGQTSTAAPTAASSAKVIVPASTVAAVAVSKDAVKSPSSSMKISVPVVKQQLFKPLSNNSDKVQPRSLSKTPTLLKTLTGPKAVSKVAVIGSGTTGSVPTTSQSASTSVTSNTGVLSTTPGAASNTNPLLSNPFPYPPPLPQASQFQYAIYPSTTVYTKSLVPPRFVNTTNPFPPDIIFSINLNSPSFLVNQTLQLHEIDFRIPIGDPSLRTNWTTDIMGGVGLVPVNSSPGVSARMLSNQRWIVHMDVEAAYLNLRVIPRTMNLTVPIMQNPTLSFKLNEVQIAGPDGKSVTIVSFGSLPVVVNITVTEIYGFYADAAKTEWVNVGSAQQQLVLQRK